MQTGEVPLKASTSRLIYQHQHATPPADKLTHVPQPIIALLEVLLEKDPTERFQTPTKLLSAVSTVEREMERRRTIKHQTLRATFVRRRSFQQKEPPAIRRPKRSIAVLPFDTLSHAKGNTYFADGVQDEILSNLAKVSQLKVISRTSVMTYRPGCNRNLRSIAESLGVANVVEGTVRRDGNRVRITIRLVNARTDKALWSESYDRDLTDIFAIQSEVAQTIALMLTARLSPEEKKRIEAKPTGNLEAYDLYLRARKFVTSFKISAAVGNVEKPLRDAIGLLEQAIRLDPKFALAHCASAQAHDLLYFLYDPTPKRRALGDAAVNRALDLQPDLPEAHITYANHLYCCYRDYERARLQLSIAKRGLPNDAEAITLEALMDRRQGNFEKAIQEFNEPMTRDPRNTIPISAFADTLVATRHLHHAAQAYERAIELSPDQPLLSVQKAYYVTSRKTGYNTALCSAIAAIPASMADDRSVLFFRLVLALDGRDWKSSFFSATRVASRNR